MFRFLLDEHISAAVARAMVAQVPGIKVVAFKDWHDGRFMGARDQVFLPEAFAEGFTFVTYDQKTIRPLLKDWSEQGVHHEGVVFVDTKTIAPQDFGRLAQALGELWSTHRKVSWTDRVVFLKRAS